MYSFFYLIHIDRDKERDSRWFSGPLVYIQFAFTWDFPFISFLLVNPWNPGFLTVLSHKRVKRKSKYLRLELRLVWLVGFDGYPDVLFSGLFSGLFSDDRDLFPGPFSCWIVLSFGSLLMTRNGRTFVSFCCCFDQRVGGCSRFQITLWV